MIAVSQRIQNPEWVTTVDDVYKLPLEQRGDCFRASVASLFEIPYEDAFTPMVEGDSDAAWAEWLSRFGLHSVRRPAKECRPPTGLYLVDGISPRGARHMCVGRYSDENGWEVVWDPHPSSAGFDEDGVQFVWELHVSDPSRLMPRPEVSGELEVALHAQGLRS